MILTIGPGGCGFTFLNWSIAFLRGDTTYQTLTGENGPMPNNPVTGSIAHVFNKDHIMINNSQVVDKNSNSIDNLHTYLECATDSSIIYIVPSTNNDFKYSLTLPGKKILFDYRGCEKEIVARSYACVPGQNSYVKLVNKLSLTHNASAVKQVFLDSAKLFAGYYEISEDHNTYLINYNEMFNILDNKIVNLLEWLNIKIDQSRWQPWNLVYQKYQQNNQDFISLFNNSDSFDSQTKIKILKDIIQWKNGSFLNT